MMIHGGVTISSMFLFSEDYLKEFDLGHVPLNLTRRYEIPDSAPMGLTWNILAYFKRPVVILAGSSESQKVLSLPFVPVSEDNRVLDVEFHPIKFLILENENFLVLYKAEMIRRVYKMTFNYTIEVLNTYPRTGETGRDMNADYLKEPFSDPSVPLISILYGERKIKIVKESDFTEVKELLIKEWSEVEPSVEGFILFVPFSNFVVCAK